MIRAVLLGVGVGAAGLQAVHARRNWGATLEEAGATLPGDELVPEPADQSTLAVTVDTPAEEIWAWLVQMGHGRGGMYSYDWLENLIGLASQGPGGTREGWRPLPVVGRVVLAPEGSRAWPAGSAFPVARVAPPRALVLCQVPPEHPWNGVWSFHVVPAGDGRCRLLARSRTEVAPQLGLRLATRVGEPVTLVMTRRMLYGIRQRAERRTTAAATRARSGSEEAGP